MQALYEYGRLLAYTLVRVTVDTPTFLLARAFGSQLREDFQSMLPTRLALAPGSLAGSTDLLVPIIAFSFSVGANYAIETPVEQDHPLVYWQTRMRSFETTTPAKNAPHACAPSFLFHKDVCMSENMLNQLVVTANSSRLDRSGGLMLTGPSVSVGLPFEPRHYLRHGWQSWSLTAWVDVDRHYPPMRPALLQPMHTDPVYAKLKNPNGSWYGAVEAPNGKVLLLGALDLESHVELESRTLQGWYESGQGDWFVGIGDEAEVFSHYAKMIGGRFGTRRIEKPPRVWCSWYGLYHQIDEGRLLKIIADLGDLPFDVIQVDDGWQRGIGDWDANEKFPSGMQALAERIKGSGRTPGLWLTPLIVVPSSTLYREHPDWLLRDGKGKPVSAGFNWFEPLFALDTTRQEVTEWLAGLMKKVRSWGYGYIKLDFLYAGALSGKRTVDMPREAAYRHVLRVIREALGDAYFLTCGAPIFPSIGLCDGMRVGPDVAEDWEDLLMTGLLQDYSNGGARDALRTAFNRVWLQPLVNPDPDAVYFRTRRNHLTADQKRLLQDLALITGFKATSDVPAWMTDDEKTALKEFLNAEPEIRRTGRTSYQVGERQSDFGTHIQMPTPARFPLSLLGQIAGSLANVPGGIVLFDKWLRRSLRKWLEANPV